MHALHSEAMHSSPPENMQIFINCLCKCPSAAQESQNRSFKWGIVQSPWSGFNKCFLGKSCLEAVLSSSGRLAKQNKKFRSIFLALFLNGYSLEHGNNRQRVEISWKLTVFSKSLTFNFPHAKKMHPSPLTQICILSFALHESKVPVPTVHYDNEAPGVSQSTI